MVLVSIDGLRPEFYLDAAWPAPTLQAMAAEGARADAVRGVFPTVTYPSHTTMITGALPARHGVFYNTPYEPGGQTGRWYWEAEAIRVPTLWHAAREAGLATASLSWPVSVGAPVDRNLPEAWSLERDAEPLAALRAATTEGFWEELERATGPFLPTYDMSYLARDLKLGAMAAHVLETHRPALMTVHFVGTDHFQHEEGREGSLVRRALAHVDSGLSQIVEAAERAGIAGRTAFVITGDHGFVDIHSKVCPNVWLVAGGLRGPAQDRGEAWRATFVTNGGAAFLHLRDPADPEAVAEVEALLAELPAGVRRTFEVLDAEALKALGAAPEAALALAAAPGYAFSETAAGAALRASGGGTHGFHPALPQIHTGLVLWGAGVREGARAPLAGLEDVAPLVAELLDLPFEAPDGVVIPGLLR